MGYKEIQKRIRRRKIRFRVCIFIIIISTTVIFLFNTPVIKVKDIIIEGNNISTKENIIELSSIKMGDNILRLNVSEINQNILINPYIEESTIKRTIFGNVYISVKERQAAGISSFNDGFVTIDKKGVVIEILDSNDGIGLPVIDGLQIQEAYPGKAMKLLDERKINTLEIIFDNIKDSQLSDIIYGVDINNLLSILIKTKHNVNIKLGTIDKIEQKLKVSKAIMEQDVLRKGLKGTIDVSYSGNPVFRQE